MNVREYFTAPKRGGQEYNEDALYIGQRFVAVVDGVTAKTAAPAGAKVSGGSFAAQTILSLLENMPDISDALQMLQWLNQNLKNAVAGSVFADAMEPPSASVILYDSRTGQIISYGDCQMLLQGTVYKREKVLDRICAEKRSKILMECMKNGISGTQLLKNDVGRKAIEPDILDSFLKYANKNVEFGFPVLGPGEIVPEFVDIYKADQGEEIVLASDGYPVLLSTLQESEAELARILSEDPLFIRDYKSTKGMVEGNRSYDDRTYIRFVI